MTLHSVHSLELLQLHAFSLDQNDDPLTQCLCSLGASVEIVSSLLFKTSANVIVVASQNTRDGSSVLDELGQRTIVRLIIRLRINTGKQKDHLSRRTIWIIRLHRRITGDNSSEGIIRL